MIFMCSVFCRPVGGSVDAVFHFLFVMLIPRPPPACGAASHCDHDGHGGRSAWQYPPGGPAGTSGMRIDRIRPNAAALTWIGPGP